MRQRRRLAAYVALSLWGAGAISYTAHVSAEGRAHIQDERARSTLVSCAETNDRNAATKAIVDKQFPHGQGRDITLLLIDALAPVRDCDALVADRVDR